MGIFFLGLKFPGHVTPPFLRAFSIFVHSSGFSLALSAKPLSQVSLPTSITDFLGMSCASEEQLIKL